MLFLGQLFGVAEHQAVDAAERRSPIARDHRSVVQPVTAIGAQLIEQHTQQRLDA